MEQMQWKIHFSWVKGHTGIAVNELVDMMAKAAAADENQDMAYEKSPKSTITSEINEIGLDRWDITTKGRISKLFFPSVKDRLKLKLPLIPVFTAIVSGHAKIKSTYIDSTLQTTQHALARQDNKQLIT